jgi:hypothetical protein
MEGWGRLAAPSARMLFRLQTTLVVLVCALAAPAIAHAREEAVRAPVTALRAPSPALRAHLALASPADPATDPLIAHFLDVARAHWGAGPNCPPGISLVRAQWLPDPGVWAAAQQGGCTIAFDPDFYPAPAGYDVRWWQAAMCSVVAHEYGHLLGYGHAGDPNSLMNAVAPINIVAGCPTWGLLGASSTPSTTKKPAAKRSACSARRSKAARRRCAAKARRRSAKR